MNTNLLAGLMFALVGSMVAQSSGARETFRATAVTRTGHLQFPAAIDVVFPLFTPLGERHWAQGWDPEIVYPKDVDVAAGMVFRTQGEGVEHVWTVTRYDPAAHTVAYNVVGIGMAVRQIEVRCRPVGANRTEVTVTDSYIGLSPEGNALVEKLGEAAYAKKMAQWQQNIDAYLATVASPAPRK